MKLRKTWSLLLILMLSVQYSCKEEGEDIEQYFLKIETTASNKVNDTLHVGADSVSQSLSVVSNGQWRISLDTTADWLNIQPNNGSGNSSFELTVEKNETLNSREVKLIGSVNGEETAVLIVKQSGRNPQLSVTPSTPANFKGSGGVIEFIIDTDSEWDYTITNGSWLTEQSKTSSKLTLEASENIAGEEREAIILFSLSSVSEVSQNVVVKQEKKEPMPIANLLDISFKADGTAEDLSTAAYNIETIEGMSMMTLYSERYERFMARFNHSPGGSVSTGYFKRDYTSDQSFIDAISDGHTLEAIFMLDVESPLPNAEIKMFSSHQSGGTGLMIGNNARNNSIIFLPHVGGNYIWANSNVTPQRGTYYHVVGVWNSDEGKAYIYVDGELKSSVSATGNFKFPSAGSTWFGVGADPTGSSAQAGWKGDVVLSRIYDKPLNQKEVEKLWDQVKDFQPGPDEIILSGVSLLSTIVQVDGSYTISGEGFKAGDKIRLKPFSGNGDEYLLDGTITANSLTMTIPGGFKSGKYRFYLVRGGKEQDMGFATLTLGSKPSGKAKVIAHRGHWNTAGSAQNSIASLVKAQELDIYGVEFDVWITIDGVVVLNHDPTINGIRIETSSYNDLKDITLSNGEKIPTLQEFLMQGKKDPSTKMILEIKSHSSSTGGMHNNDRAAKAIVDLVKELDMVDQVEYISFNIGVCKKLLQLQPGAIVANLSGNYTPESLFNEGIIGIDYNMATLRKYPLWIQEAHDLGMTVNVWTVNSESDLQEMVNMGVDFITTDAPILAKQVVERN